MVSLGSCPAFSSPEHVIVSESVIPHSLTHHSYATQEKSMGDKSTSITVCVSSTESTISSMEYVDCYADGKTKRSTG